jgi:hypothetical protein
MGKQHHGKKIEIMAKTMRLQKKLGLRKKMIVEEDPLG